MTSESSFLTLNFGDFLLIAEVNYNTLFMKYSLKIPGEHCRASIMINDQP